MTLGPAADGLQDRLPDGPVELDVLRPVGPHLDDRRARPERVVEVRYDHMEGVRFRHTAQFVRWRPDKDPADCTYEQLDEPVSYDLSAVLSGGGA